MTAEPPMARPRLRITGVETVPIRIPFRHVLTESVGRYEEITPVLLLVHTDAGVTGLGAIVEVLSQLPPEATPSKEVVVRHLGLLGQMSKTRD